MVEWALNNCEDYCCFRQSGHKKSSHSEHQTIALTGEMSKAFHQACSMLPYF
jgi:hypothetical protein